jgi:hypothetical protein
MIACDTTLKIDTECIIEENGVLPHWTYQYRFDHQRQATFGLVSTLRGDRLNAKYAAVAVFRYSHIVRPGSMEAWVRKGPHNIVTENIG